MAGDLERHLLLATKPKPRTDSMDHFYLSRIVFKGPASIDNMESCVSYHNWPHSLQLVLRLCPSAGQEPQ